MHLSIGFCRTLFLKTLLGTLIGVLSNGHSAVAADRLVVTYGTLQASFAISDLETFAHTGDAPSSLSFYLNLANIDAETVRSILATPITIEHHLLDQALNTQGGEQLLSQVTQIIHTPSQQANLQALRAALVLSASDDRQISLLEVLKNYPTQQVYVDSIHLIQFAQDLTTEPIVASDGIEDEGITNR